tara:strand:- start:77 stop:331 length:255 start_codon:yes stop_codon:yes gene_type:complete
MKLAFENIDRAFVEVTGDDGFQVRWSIFQGFHFPGKNGFRRTIGKFSGAKIAHIQDLKFITRAHLHSSQALKELRPDYRFLCAR